MGNSICILWNFRQEFIRPVCRMRTHLSCSYIRNFVTRGAGSVVVSASDRNDICPGLISGCSIGGLLYLVWKAVDGDWNYWTVRLVLYCYVSRTLTCLIQKVPKCRTGRYTLIQRLAYVCTLRPNTVEQVRTSKERRRRKKAVSPSSLRSTMPPS